MSPPMIWELVVQDMHKRDEYGRRTHPLPLDGDHPMDSLTEAYEEALDLAVYLRLELWKREDR